MKTYRYLFMIALTGLLFSCNEGGGESGVEEDALVQTRETLDMEDETVLAVKSVEIVAKEMDYHPNEILAQPGQMLEVTLINNGERPHNIEFELPQGEKLLDTPVEPGNRASLSFEAPAEAGEYTFYCPVENHKDLGMVGKLIVRQ